MKELYENGYMKALADAGLSGISERNIEERLDLNGPGISLGNPIAATGTMGLRLCCRKCGDAMRHGLETGCGGGQGICLTIGENPKQKGLS